MSMSGLELLQAVASGKLPSAAIGATMGMGKMVAEKGHIIIHAQADKRHLNPLGGVHGGFAATLLDSVTGCAVHSLLEAGVGFGTVDLSVKMLRPIPVDTEVISEARVTHISQAIGVAEGTIKDADGRLLASASATCYIKRPR